jgi:hypothetical protein
LVLDVQLDMLLVVAVEVRSSLPGVFRHLPCELLASELSEISPEEHLLLFLSLSLG